METNASAVPLSALQLLLFLEKYDNEVWQLLFFEEKHKSSICISFSIICTSHN